MATPTFVDRPFPDLDIPDVLDPSSQRKGAVPVGGSGLSEETETDDRLSRARGILLALLLCAPCWMAVYWLFS
jgi:hypothetical protein